MKAFVVLLLQVALLSEICTSLECSSWESFESLEEHHDDHDHDHPNANDHTCSLPAETGPCRAKFLRFFFNKRTGKCENFYYGGCRGNSNKFQTVEECEQACKKVCDLPMEVGQCKGDFSRYYFNKSTGTCEQFSYGGCKGNGNNFLTLESCEQRCRPINVCTLPKKVGPCKGAFPRYYFNTRTVRCERFSYGGCEGNGNNFLTREECRRRCY